MIIVIGSDHAGYPLKQLCQQYLATNCSFLDSDKDAVVDVGTYSCDSVHYPSIAEKVGKAVNSVKPNHPPQVLGIAICGTGIGISISLNKMEGIRCALCHDGYTAQMAREHNNANVLALGSRCLSPEQTFPIIDQFLETPFDTGSRHQLRVKLIEDLEHSSAWWHSINGRGHSPCQKKQTMGSPRPSVAAGGIDDDQQLSKKRL